MRNSYRYVLAMVVLVLAGLSCTKVTPTPLPVVIANTGTSQIPTIAATIPVPTLDIGTNVIVTANLVNIRTANKKTQGIVATVGKEMQVIWREDGYGEIVYPQEWVGMLVWRGCTSDPGPYGCESE